MARIVKIEEFDAWVKARALNVLIQKMVLCESIRLYPYLQSQMQRNSRSVMANLAEGFSRKGNAEFINFISIAMGSLIELKSDCYMCSDLNLISQEQYDESMSLINDVGKLSNGMSRYLRNSPYKGTKFIRKP